MKIVNHLKIYRILKNFLIVITAVNIDYLIGIIKSIYIYFLSAWKSICREMEGTRSSAAEGKSER